MEQPFTGNTVQGMVPLETEKEESRKLSGKAASMARGTGQEGNAPLSLFLTQPHPEDCVSVKVLTCLLLCHHD